MNAVVIVKNRFALDDSIELMTPQGNLTFDLKHIEDQKGKGRTDAPGDGHVLFIPVPENVNLEHALVMRNLTSGNTRGA